VSERLAVIVVIGPDRRTRARRRSSMKAAEAFFMEWERRAPGARRSVRRAGLLAEELGISAPGMPVLTVVGSKGKGTAATYASAYLSGSGHRVAMVTSPGLRGNADRIRVDGVAISEHELAELGRRLQHAARSLPDRHDDGYLSPSGLYILACVLRARAAGADAIVLEAGMGGVSDEVSLFAPTVLAITEVFHEHIGVLGDSPAEIAKNKAGIATAATSAVVSLRQSPPVTAAISATVAATTGDAVKTEVISSGASGVPGRLLPAGFGRMNAELGCVAARRLLDATTRPEISGDRLAKVLSSVVLPGRFSWHAVPGTGTTVFIDSAINRAGAAAALIEAYRRWDRVDHVVVCLPDHKDVPGVITELAGLPVTYVRMPTRPSLTFTHPLPDDWSVTDNTGLSRERLASLGERIVVLGTVYFTGWMLEMIGADTARLYES
jgi:folylpolyglutamate synthase/dihydrofolate synthase